MALLDSIPYVDYEVKGVELPPVILEKHHYEEFGMTTNVDNEELLRSICRKSFDDFLSKGIIPADQKKVYVDRVKYELSIFKECGFIDYVLLVWLVIRLAEENNIPMGAGRGSCGGSLILFLIGAVVADPIKYGLYFERFISRARVKKVEEDGKTYLLGALCDVDLDVDSDKRHILIQKLAEVYDGYFCGVCNINTLKTASLIKDCLKIVREYNEDDALFYSKKVPRVYSQPIPFDELKEMEFIKPILDDKIVHIAELLENLPIHSGVHASAFLVTKEPLDDCVPLHFSREGELVCSWDKRDVEDEFIKLDLLGLQGVGLIKETCDQIGIQRYDIDHEDPFIFDQLQDLQHRFGLFQISADTNFGVCRQIKPTNLGELSDVVAIARPGALSQKDTYCEVKEGRASPQEIHPKIDEILAATHGQLLYQETLLRIVHEVYEFSLEEADDVRRCVGKKDVKGMAAWKDKLYQRGQELQLETSVTDFYWGVLEASANYSFNMSHSISYSVLAAYTVYLKFKYPQEFFLSCFRLMGDDLKDVFKISKELPHFGIDLYPPDVIHSSIDFKLEGSGIRYGLKSIKHISEKTFDALKSFIDSEKPNKFSVFEAGKQAKLNKAVMSALIAAGALESVSEGATRNDMYFECCVWYELKDHEKVYCLNHGEEHGWNLRSLMKCIDDWTNEKGKRVAAKTRKNTIRKNVLAAFQIKKINDKCPKLASWVHERRLLGYSYSYFLRDLFTTETGEFIQSVSEAVESHKDDRVDFVAEATEVKKWKSKSGNQCFKVLLDDEFSQACGIIVGENKIAEFDLPKEGDIVRIQGLKGDENTVWIDRMTIQDVKVVFEARDLDKIRKLHESGDLPTDS